MGPRNETALLVIDAINPFDFPEADELLARAERMVTPLVQLMAQCRQSRVPVIYVNDNFGRWRSNFHELIAFCEAGPGRDVVRALHPTKEDYFVLKPHRSAFYSTPLELLLASLHVGHLALAGFTTDMCILATASDARMRSYDTKLVVDCTASFSDARQERAVLLMRETCDVTVQTAHELSAQIRTHRGQRTHEEHGEDRSEE